MAFRLCRQCRASSYIQYHRQLQQHQQKQQELDHPRICIQPLYSARDCKEREAVLVSIKKALTENGYFVVTGIPGLGAEYIASIYRLAAQLHGLPTKVKKNFAKAEGRGTYTGQDVGVAEEAYEVGTVATVRSWDYMRNQDTKWPILSQLNAPLPSISSSRVASRDHNGDPAASLAALYDRQDALARVLMQAFAESFHLPSNLFLDMFKDGDLGTIRLLHYPEARDDAEVNARAMENAKGAMERQVGISAHTDFEFFTLMHQQQPGLQLLVQHSEGEDCGQSQPKWRWVDAPTAMDDHGAMLVIAGDIFERFTNGVVRALPHRVLCTPHARNSIIRFNAVHPDTVVEPLDVFIGPERPRAYGRTTMRKHMETTMSNLAAGKGAWSSSESMDQNDPGRSLTATYNYEQEREEEGV